MQDGFTLVDMLKNGWPVISVLVTASIFSLAIIYQRVVVLRRAQLDPHAFITSVLELLKRRGIPHAVAYCERYSQPLAQVVRTVIITPGDREAKERMLFHSLRHEMRNLETFVPVLGTVGSIAPFVGLLGTVMGIIKAFRDIAVHAGDGGGMQVVSSGIAEALITTAGGLFVAIPAIVGYNYCLTRVRRLSEEIELAAYLVIDPLIQEDEG